jgi:hypothetical protein
MRGFVVLVAVAVGCVSGKAEECAAEAAEVGRFLGAMDSDVQVLQLGFDPVARDDARRIDELLPLVEVDGADIVLGGERLEPPALGDELRAVAAQQRSYRAMAGSLRASEGAYYLAVAPETPWRQVAPVLATAVEAGFRAPRLVFARGATVVAWPRSKIDDRIDALVAKHCTTDRRGVRRCDGGGLATGLAGILEEVAKPCPELTAVFGAAASGEPGDRAARIIAGIEPALVACRCKADPAAVRSAMFALLHDPRPLGYRSIELKATGGGATFTLAPETPWREASLRLVAAPGPVAIRTE